jgi:hypothetical protein
MSLEERLLALAASVTWDGGDQVIRSLRPMLEEWAPFHVGEVALARPVGHARWTLTDDEASVAADDILMALEAEPLRIDHLSEASAFPRTQARMRDAGLRSLLVLPLSAFGGPGGAIVLGHRDGWSFVAASLHVLCPLAAMTGLCLERAVALTALRKEVETLRASTRKG